MSVNIDKLDKFIYETPVSYDDETDALVGTSTNQKSPWVFPPGDLSIPEIKKWVREMSSKGVFKKILGNGATRVALYNDDKTVFKFNYSEDSYIGNQIEKEVSVYNKYKTKYSDILPKFYRYNKNWIIQQRMEPFSIDKFLNIVNLDGFPELKDKMYFKVHPFFEKMDYLFLSHGFSLIAMLHNSPSFEVGVRDARKAGIVLASFKEWEYSMLKNNTVYKILSFCSGADVTMADIKPDNLGFDGDKMKIIDFGFFDKM